MARDDYKNMANPEPEVKQRNAPGWLWMLVGLILGAFVMGLVWLKLEPAAPDSEWVGAKPDHQPQRVQKEPEPAPEVVEVPPHKPRFEFFEKLRKKEVVVPDEQLELRETKPDPTARYQIQVGSFIKPSDAERVKAELALLGLETRVYRVDIGAGKVRHRVVAGPYLGWSALQKARKRLMANGFQQLLVKVVK